MKNNANDKSQSSMFARRFRQINFFTILMLVMAILSTALLGHSKNPITINSIIAVGAIILCSVFPMITKNKFDLAKQVYLWTNIFLISLLFYDRGGMVSSSVLLVFPLFLMVTALLGNTRTFAAIYLFVISLVFFVSVQTINNDEVIIVSDFGYWELTIVLIILTASGCTAWRFNGDMKYAIRKLRTEVENVNQSRSEIERLIHYDPLTGLSSRLDCEEKYIVLRDEIDKDKDEISFLFIDIDNFKSINDYYNHTTGDEVLKEVANRLLALIKDDDIACRLSGDEFLLILKRPKKYNVKELSKRILRKVSNPAELQDNKIEITASLGIAMRDNQLDEGFESLLKRADLAMYRAKQSGKNKCSFYDEGLFLESSRKNRIINGLRDALANNDLELYLQPKVDIATGKVKSAEALVRWVRNNPEDISPAEFIPLIESTELICKLGEWVINQACILCKELHNNGYEDIPVSVNISSAQFVRGGLEKVIIKELYDSQLQPHFLELELTEHILFQDDKSVLSELSRIKDLGVSLSIDDFGTGYSNLGYLTKFKVDSLKIDQSFVKDIYKSSENFAIVDAIIKMAKTLGLKIIAEGVETKEEWDVLKHLGCDQGQGFLWSKPLSSNDFLKHISESV